MSNNFDIEDGAMLRNAKNYEEAKNVFLEIVERSSAGNSKRPISPNKIAYYKRKANEFYSKKQLESLFWNMFLEGEGLGNPNSTYKKNFKSWSQEEL